MTRRTTVEPYYWVPEPPAEITAIQTAISEATARTGMTGEEVFRAFGELLNAVFPSSPPPPAPWKRLGGRPPEYDWAAVEAALETECKLQESIPRPDHSDLDWRTLANACTFVREKFNWAAGGPSESWLRAQVRLILARIDAK